MSRTSTSVLISAPRLRTASASALTKRPGLMKCWSRRRTPHVTASPSAGTRACIVSRSSSSTAVSTPTPRTCSNSSSKVSRSSSEANAARNGSACPDRLGQTAGRELVERIEGLPIGLGEHRHGGAPLRRRAVPGEVDEELQESRVRGQRDVDRRRGLERRLDAAGQDRGVRQRMRQGRGDPSGVAPRRARSDPGPVDDRHAYALGLQEPGGRQPDHAGSDDHDVLGLSHMPIVRCHPRPEQSIP